MALTTQFVKLSINGVVLCIKSFPDLDPHGNPDQIEVTDLCDEYHKYIDGLKNYADDLEFTANYDETKFGTYDVKEYDSTADYAVGDLARHEGKTFKCKTAITGGEAWTSSHWEDTVVELLLCNASNDTAGKNGKFTISACDLSVRLTGGGVGDVMEMVYVVRPRSGITFSTVA